MGHAGRTAGAAGARAATRPRGCCDTVPVRSARGHARPGRGLVRWLGQLGAHADSLVFDSGVFLSHRMDSVHEHCSSRNFSEKKKIIFKNIVNSNTNQIKSNKF